MQNRIQCKVNIELNRRVLPHSRHSRSDYFASFAVQGEPAHVVLGKLRQRNRHVRHEHPLRCGTLIYFKFISNASIMFKHFRAETQ